MPRLHLFKQLLTWEQWVAKMLDKRVFFPAQARNLKNMLNELEEKAESFVDVGSGPGFWGDELINLFPLSRVVSTDIEARHEGKSEFIRADGNHLPFEDYEFDVATIFYSLHHVEDPSMVLLEAKRVAKIIVVQEDTYLNTFQKWFYEWHLRSYRINFALSEGLRVRKDADWLKVFEQAGLVVINKKRLFKLGYPVQRIQYVLKSS